MNAVQKANTAVVELLDTNTSLNYIRCLIRTNGRLRAKTSILTKRNDAATAVLSEGKDRQSGERKSIQGKNIMTAEEVHSVKHAELARRERKRKRSGSSVKRDVMTKARSDNDVAMPNNVQVLEFVAGGVVISFEDSGN